MTKKRKTYKCGKCKATGHNARTCPTKGTKSKKAESKKAADVAETVKAEVAAVDTLTETTKPQFPLDGSTDLTKVRRGEPTGKPAVPAAPYTCPSCSQIAVLVLVELPDTKVRLRCEKCHNSTPISKILKWGAMPKDKPAEAWHRRALI